MSREKNRIEVEKVINDDDISAMHKCNEGKLNCSFNEDKNAGYLILDLHAQKYLSSSLTPECTSTDIKHKIFRLKLHVQEESCKSTTIRSVTSSNLSLIIQKFNQKTLNFVTSATVAAAKRTQKSKSKGNKNEKLHSKPKFRHRTAHKCFLM